MSPSSKRNLAGTGMFPVSVVAWIALRVIFEPFHLVPLIDRLWTLLFLTGGIILAATAAARPAEWRSRVSLGLVAMLTGLTLFWLGRPDRAWMVSAILAACLWIVSLISALRAARNERVSNDME